MGRKTKKEIDEETMQMWSLHQQGKNEDEIAEMYGVHRTTVSRRLSALKKKLNEASQMALQKREESNFEIDEQNPIPGLTIPTTNPFDILTDFNEIARASVTAGSVPGSAVAYIINGFNDDGSKTTEQRATMVMKGFASVGGFIFGLIETSKSLNPGPGGNKNIRLIKEDDE